MLETDPGNGPFDSYQEVVVATEITSYTNDNYRYQQQLIAHRPGSSVCFERVIIGASNETTAPIHIPSINIY